MSYRFYSQEPIRFRSAGETSAQLRDSEAHHFLHVMRGGIGDRVTLFDGSGYEFVAEVTQSTRRDVTLAVLSQAEVDREPAVAVTLGVALPKGDRQKVLLDMLTQLGVARLVPLATEHSVAAPKGSGLDKLRRSVIEASKQCGRNRLMAIDEPMGLEDFLATTQADVRLIAHPMSGATAIEKAGKSVAIAIGPEGGFADAEVAKAAAIGWEAVSFGKSILRIETAAIAAAALYSIAKNKN